MDQIMLAGCVIKNADGHMLFLHRNTAKRRQWEIPGGKLDPGEEAAGTAVREVREEAGIKVEIVRELGTTSFDEDGCTMIYTWFLAEIISGVPTVQEPQTHDRCEYLGLSDLQERFQELSLNTRNFLTELVSGRVEV